MSILLGIETATKVCSIALSNENELLAIEEVGGAYSHAENVTNFIEKVVKKANINFNDIDAIAVSKGPGSYTGLRIGVSSAKGLCYALNKPLIAIDTLQAMALRMAKQISVKNLFFCPMIDARRMEVYTAIYNANNELVEPISAKIIDENSFSKYLDNQKVMFFGDGAEKCKTLFSGNKNAFFNESVLPSAIEINELALKKLNNNQLEDVAYFEPFYLKDFIATTPKKII
ncbi:MAG: tRNA (adenosine(37)-N6)-threonylcarbamoyltransferase complex dimerization subunit type 1 TsaB [Flavobacteriales bacterium]|nr:tRNA (adenosine(37)-N6)-threonylcarbamoyltransferase complex dimerization subunit type 1 TsaB [Flavobacteriales bacterium]MCW8912914.1 tRNA (adenosine(37)-N6)-threonylcarbamoyltransferase complex dimerization subunit type 1 TsaB [Flavobacteriales bacterium]MCW8938483.1 tRNA (adenosine(37)-N6)-threonylcarbamoyltransferase complex dimerization subunit type 1 TsaB [Flavobacteriales bacterium]MCW8940994.1 tRNA (adenosine(37)-N6)-threonylcarbamoyltransferase complex dimerization subunit type 1 Tsa